MPRGQRTPPAAVLSGGPVAGGRSSPAARRRATTRPPTVEQRSKKNNVRPLAWKTFFGGENISPLDEGKHTCSNITVCVAASKCPVDVFPSTHRFPRDAVD